MENYVPSQRHKKAQMGLSSVAKDLIEDVLKSHIKGRNAKARIEKAAVDVLESISHLFDLRNISTKPKGATIMTEAASAHNVPGVAPRNI